MDKRMMSKGMNNQILALKVGVSQQHLSNVRNGTSNASPKLASAISDLLGCEIEDLFEIKIKEA
ncbi:helix-turn-helix transcriptional regulator [Macrococcus equi]|uniref:helix-turn-helix transcriptional regulator n=1 Tax=Macrococcus equi TaxID=3395462 RepID=UPI0039BE84BA